jgi:transketolase
MLNKEIYTNKYENLEKKATREGFGDALLDLGKKYDNVVAFCADLTESTQMHKFKNEFPERFVQIGIAEQNMASVASGMSAMGFVPFIASYAVFSPGRNLEQIRTTVCYNNRKVIIVGAHAGLSVGPDGGTHQALEDIAIMRAMPNITILSPCDYYEAYQMTIQAYQIPGPVYIRITREKTPLIYSSDYVAKIGKGEIIYLTKIESTKKVGIIVTGPIIYETLIAAQKLNQAGIEVNVLNINTIKNLDTNQIVLFAKNNKKIITVEEHQRVGGLGSMVSEILSQNHPTLMKIIGVKERFGQSGSTSELYKEYGLDSESIFASGQELAWK